MPNLEHAQFSDFLAEHSRAGRDVQLFDVYGQTMFPMCTPDGALRTDCAVYPILHGEGERVIEFKGSLPTKDGETLDLGNGWIVMCVLFHYDQTLMGKMTKLERAEDKLRAMKSGGQNAA